MFRFDKTVTFSQFDEFDKLQDEFFRAFMFPCLMISIWTITLLKRIGHVPIGSTGWNAIEFSSFDGRWIDKVFLYGSIFVVDNDGIERSTAGMCNS